METEDYATKLQAILEEEEPSCLVRMYFILATHDQDRFISQMAAEPLLEELRRFLMEVERSF